MYTCTLGAAACEREMLNGKEVRVCDAIVFFTPLHALSVFIVNLFPVDFRSCADASRLGKAKQTHATALLVQGALVELSSLPLDLLVVHPQDPSGLQTSDIDL